MRSHQNIQPVGRVTEVATLAIGPMASCPYGTDPYRPLEPCDIRC